MENNNHWLTSLIVFILLICGCNATGMDPRGYQADLQQVQVKGPVGSEPTATDDLDDQTATETLYLQDEEPTVHLESQPTGMRIRSSTEESVGEATVHQHVLNQTEPTATATIDLPPEELTESDLESILERTLELFAQGSDNDTLLSGSEQSEEKLSVRFIDEESMSPSFGMGGSPSEPALQCQTGTGSKPGQPKLPSLKNANSAHSTNSLVSFSSRSASSGPRVSTQIVSSCKSWIDELRRRKCFKWIEFAVRVGTATLQIVECIRMCYWFVGDHDGEENITRYDGVANDETRELFKPYLIGIFVLNVLKMRNVWFEALAHGGMESEPFSQLRAELGEMGKLKKYVWKPLQFIFHPNSILKQSAWKALFHVIFSIPLAFLAPLVKLRVDFRKAMDKPISKDLECFSSLVDYANALTLAPSEIILRIIIFTFASVFYSPSDLALIHIYWMTLWSIILLFVNILFSAVSYPAGSGD